LNALAYAAGMARRLERPLLVVYVTARGAHCEPLTGQVVRTVSDDEHRRRLASRSESCSERRWSRRHRHRLPSAAGP
jgi:hypothetical protein